MRPLRHHDQLNSGLGASPSSPPESSPGEGQSTPPAPSIRVKSFYRCLDPEAPFIGEVVRVTQVTPARVIYQVVREDMVDWAVSTPPEHFRSNFIHVSKPDCAGCEE